MKDEKPNAYFMAGSAGMVVFFGTLLIAGEDDAPRWLLTIAFLVMLIFLPLGWYVDRRAKHSGR